MSDLAQRIASVQARIVAAAGRAGRDPAGVTLIAVSKTVDRAAIDQAYHLGVRDFGENRVQDAVSKFSAPWPDDARRHMIGSLQSNKAGLAIDLFDLIHSVDRLSLIGELERLAARRRRVVHLLLQVNLAGESQKSGCAPHEAEFLARRIAAAGGLGLQGLMTMAPLVDDPERARPVFRGLSSLRNAIRDATGLPLPVLSMGMTNDFEVAIEEGATHVRIGRAIFGDGLLAAPKPGD
jgi:pyridoxal phosphate enzyme (YggS family)